MINKAKEYDQRLCELEDRFYEEITELTRKANSEEEVVKITDEWSKRFQEASNALYNEFHEDQENPRDYLPPLEIDNPPIKGLDYRDDSEVMLSMYSFEAPSGEWEARLDDRMWGRSANLLLFFSQVSTGNNFVMSVFNNNNYSPNGGTVKFRDEGIGRFYRLTVGETRTGRTVLKKAEGPL